jgi:galactose mutarotase-like enzyme
MNITIQNNFLKATINTKGAELNSLVKIADGKEYIWEGNPVFWGKHSPVLFPIVGTLKDNCYFYENQKYELPRHGFARDMEFDVIHQTEKKVIFLLKNNAKTIQHFPFKFELKITYYFNDYKLNVEYNILNMSDKDMPFSIGGHPAFALNENFEDYTLHFEKQEVLKSYELHNDLLSNNFNIINLQNKKLPLSYSLFEKDALIFKEIKSKKVTIKHHKIPLLRFHYKDFPNLGIWTKNKAGFICIEPWLGYSDIENSNQNILEKEGITILKSLHFQTHEFTIEIL